MANTYTLISSNVLTGSAASVTFSSIPATYTDLVLRASIRSDVSAATYGLYVTFAGIGGTAYSYTRVGGEGTTTYSDRGSSAAYAFVGHSSGATATSNTFNSIELYIPNYAGSTNKPFSSFAVVENNSATANKIAAIADLMSNTTSITSLIIDSQSANNFVAGSSFYLYGIKNA